MGEFDLGGGRKFVIKLSLTSAHNSLDEAKKFHHEDELQKIKIAEKPKKENQKEQPKSSPDDDKIVPAFSGSGFFDFSTWPFY